MPHAQAASRLLAGACRCAQRVAADARVVEELLLGARDRLLEPGAALFGQRVALGLGVLEARVELGEHGGQHGAEQPAIQKQIKREGGLQARGGWKG